MKRLIGPAALALACGCASGRGVERPATPWVLSEPLSMQADVSDAVGSLAGVWRSRETGSEATVIDTSEGFLVTGVIDDDGEVYTMTASDWDGVTLSWSLHVPSTGYDVRYAVRHDVTQDVLSGRWAGTAGEGEAVLDRVD